MSAFNYPLLLDPIPVPKVWGGGKLAGIPGRSVPSGGADPIGESWDLSTWPTAPDNPNLVTVNRIVNGPLAGRLLSEVVDVPVVAKVIDSADRLSVQNHPVLPDAHKDEMWYILEADPGAFLYMGLAEGVDAARFCEALRREPTDEEAVLGMLSARPCEPGSHFTVPTGTVHAIGAGLLTFEISEKTQVTYRLYDYNRERSRGKLDLNDGCAAIVTSRPDRPVLEHGLVIGGACAMEIITEFPTFCVTKVTGERITVMSAQHMHLVTATRGNVKLSGPSADWNIDLGYTFTCLVPATSEPYEIDTCGGGEVLIAPLRD